MPATESLLQRRQNSMPAHSDGFPQGLLPLSYKETVGGFLLGLGLTGGYVAALYILPHQLSRDHRQTVHRRMACTLGYSCLAWMPVYKFLDCQDVWQLSQQIGLRKEGLSQAIFYPLLTTGLLFLGPLIQRLTSKDDQTRYPEPLLSSPAAWRDLFVAPLTEEFVFRCLVIAILLHMGLTPGTAILTAPLYFGVAHIHHYKEYVCHKGMSKRQAFQLVAFQFMYTTVFGWLAAWYFVRYRHVLAAVIPHVFCNFMGLPDVSAIAGHRLSTLISASYLAGILGFTSVLLYQACKPDLKGLQVAVL